MGDRIQPQIHVNAVANRYSQKAQGISIQRTTLASAPAVLCASISRTSVKPRQSLSCMIPISEFLIISVKLLNRSESLL